MGSPEVEPRSGETPGKDEKHIGTPVRGDIMRGMNIPDGFMSLQCTKNKHLTT